MANTSDGPKWTAWSVALKFAPATKTARIESLNAGATKTARAESPNAAPATKTARAELPKKTHQNELDGWKHDGWALASG